jgi:hypothetical protein
MDSAPTAEPEAFVMPRHYMQQSEPSATADAPSVSTHLPAPTVLGGFETRNQFCDKHNEWYPQFRQPRAELCGLPWIGQCDACKADAKLEQQARVILSDRSEAVQGRVESMLAATEDDRQRRVIAKLQPIIEDERARLEAHERWQDSQRFRSEAEAEELSEIIRDLQSKG